MERSIHGRVNIVVLGVFWTWASVVQYQPYSFSQGRGDFRRW
jgi:hypothetical protein